MMNLKDMPSLAFLGSRAALAKADGHVEHITQPRAAALLEGSQPVLLCHALFTARKLMIKHVAAPIFDVMELFAFTQPAVSCVPTPAGLAKIFDDKPPQDACAAALFVRQAAEVLLKQLAQTMDEDALPLAEMMRRGGWRWGEIVCCTLPPQTSAAKLSAPLFSIVSRHLPQWQPPLKKKTIPSPQKIDPEQADAMLKKGLGAQAEPRAGQMAYMRDVMEVFAPRRAISSPPVMLAEAGTGIGKTMGYLVPAFLAAKQHDAPVWIVTYTRALQNQIDNESARLIPDRHLRAKKVAIRKGRENYLCLLNFEESLRQGGMFPVLAGLMARWAGRTRDGDIRSGDFPSWLITRTDQARFLSSLTDRRATCIHSACPHYRRCFIERQRAASAGAEIVIANHALVLSHSLFDRPSSGDESKPPYYIFDEGHHIFSAADNTFSFRLTGMHMAELRHWLIGEGTRALGWAEKGLAPRIEDLLRENPDIKNLLDDVCAAAVFLPRAGWRNRIARGHSLGAAEEFLCEIRSIVLAHAEASQWRHDEYSLEAEMTMLKMAGNLKKALQILHQKMVLFMRGLAVLPEDQSSSAQSMKRVLARWVEHDLPAWIAMSARAEESGGLVQWIDRLVIERDGGHELDVGMCRNALDPARIFAEKILERSSGTLITSASLRVRGGGGGGSSGTDWQGARQRTGVDHLPYEARCIYKASPFDYARQARVFIVTDMDRDAVKAARAMALLFSASRGGGLGLWTAISRLKGAYGLIARHMRRSGRLLLAQHIDSMAVSVLMDIFREDEESCLLGTDALRDGVDVPGQSLRLIAFDRVPWPRSDILHRVRRNFFGQRRYDDMITGLRLQQAFGRLIRRQTDRGVFVLLDRRFPSRLEHVFPEGIEVVRLPLAQVLRQVRAFFGNHG